ncbi:MAG: hypothetical protein LBO72_10540, partial [Helicobacteraceae bacterium]|nr:hypothetical protein [Helicobacteraceae bacterium]
AIADFDQVIRLNPRKTYAYYNRAFAYRKLGDMKSATRDARKACELGDCGQVNYLEENKLLSD